MPNDKFDLALWNARWSDEFIAANLPTNTDFESPFEAVVREYHLRRLFEECPDIERIPVDYFVFGLGEPTNRATTKIGGVPYLPADKDWPSDEFGPLQFYFQVNFSDSVDIVGSLPGDLLLAFCSYEPCLEADFVFLWVDEDPSRELIDPTKARAIQGEEPEIAEPLYGEIHRTVEMDVDHSQDRMTGANNHLFSGSGCANRIGGLDRSKDSRCLFRLETVGARSEVPQPWLNREAPYSPEELGGHYKTFLAIGDMGSIGFLLRDDGTIEVDIRSY